MSSENTSELVAENLKSSNGNPYEIGRAQEEIDKTGDAEPQSDLDAKNSFTINVDWKVGNNNWVNTTDEVRRVAAITRYKLYRNEPGINFAYTLEFSNTEHYDYYFTDGEGDNYNVNTWLNRDHYVQYNSNKPNIKMLKGD